MKKIVLLLIMFFVFSKNVNASCDYSQMARLKKIASNVNISYDYIITDNKPSFNITISNLTDDVYFHDLSRNKKYYKKEFTLSGFKDGTTYKFYIKSNVKECKDTILLTKFVDLPQYNIYYGDLVCKGIEDYDLCQRWGKFKKLSYDDYIKAINAYKKSLIKDEEIVIPKEKEPIINKIISIFINYYHVFLISIIIICLSIIMYLSKKDKFDF